MKTVKLCFCSLGAAVLWTLYISIRLICSAIGSLFKCLFILVACVAFYSIFQALAEALIKSAVDAGSVDAMLANSKPAILMMITTIVAVILIVLLIFRIFQIGGFLTSFFFPHLSEGVSTVFWFSLDFILSINEKTEEAYSQLLNMIKEEIEEGALT